MRNVAYYVENSDLYRTPGVAESDTAMMRGKWNFWLALADKEYAQNFGTKLTW